MPNKADLERLELNMLAMYCLKVVESRDSDSTAIDQARILKRDWALLIGYAKPPLPETGTKHDSEAQAKILKEQMVCFLSGCSLFESATPDKLNPELKEQGVAAGYGK